MIKAYPTPKRLTQANIKSRRKYIERLNKVRVARHQDNPGFTVTNLWLRHAQSRYLIATPRMYAYVRWIHKYVAFLKRNKCMFLIERYGEKYCKKMVLTF